MRKVLIGVTLVLLLGCRSKAKQESTVAKSSDPTVALNIATNGPIVLKEGVLIVPCRVTNNRDRFVQVFFDRCQVEDTNGVRRQRKPASATTCTIGPGKTESFKLIFGEPRTPLAGSAFRIWLWVQPTDGSGVLENVPPLVFDTGNASFAAPAHGFTKTDPQKDMLPPPTEAPPAVQPFPAGTETAPCPTCGEPRPKGSSACPHCGLP